MTETPPEPRVQPLDDAEMILWRFRDVVDDLLPLLKPYEAAFYVHLFRHSWAATGQPLVRLRYRNFQTEVVKTIIQRGRDLRLTICPKTISLTLGGLAALGAIRREEAATPEGAVYRVFLPEQIEACRLRRAAQAQRRAARTNDFYNIRENRRKIYERDAYTCRYCRKSLTPYTVTLDHLIPVVAGGDNGFDNVVTACRECNSQKHRKSLGDFLADQSRPRRN